MQSDRTEPGRETYQFAGGLISVLADGAHTDGRYALLLARTPPGNATPPHFHDTDTETMVMLDGVVTVETPGRSQLLYARELAILPPAQVHRLSNSGTTDANYLLLCIPAGFEDFVRQAGTRVANEAAVPTPMDQDDVRLLVDSAPAYGVRLTDGAELVTPMDQGVPVAPRETFVALGTMIEVVARFDEVVNGPVLIRATALPKTISPFAQRTKPQANEGRFFAGLSGGSISGTFSSRSVPALLAVTNRQVLRLLRQDDMAEPTNAEGSALGRLMLVLDSLHTQIGQDPTNRPPPVAPGQPS
jgi:quercetin dioxygenase-like cupin family protein